MTRSGKENKAARGINAGGLPRTTRWTILQPRILSGCIMGRKNGHDGKKKGQPLRVRLRAELAKEISLNS